MHRFSWTLIFLSRSLGTTGWRRREVRTWDGGWPWCCGHILYLPERSLRLCSRLSREFLLILLHPLFAFFIGEMSSVRLVEILSARQRQTLLHFISCQLSKPFCRSRFFSVGELVCDLLLQYITCSSSGPRWTLVCNSKAAGAVAERTMERKRYHSTIFFRYFTGHTSPEVLNSHGYNSSYRFHPPTFDHRGKAPRNSCPWSYGITRKLS